MNNITTKIKILFVLIIAFFISSFINKDFYLENTPTPRLTIKEYLAEKTGFLKEEYLAFTSSLKITNKSNNKEIVINPKIKEDIKEEIDSVPFKFMSKGIYAQNKGEVTKITIKDGEVDWGEARTYNVNINGVKKTVTIKYQKGQVTNRSQNEIEKELQSMLQIIKN